MRGVREVVRRPVSRRCRPGHGPLGERQTVVQRNTGQYLLGRDDPGCLFGKDERCARNFRDGWPAHQAGRPGDSDANKQFSPQYEEQI